MTTIRGIISQCIKFKSISLTFRVFQTTYRLPLLHTIKKFCGNRAASRGVGTCPAAEDVGGGSEVTCPTRPSARFLRTLRFHDDVTPVPLPRFAQHLAGVVHVCLLSSSHVCLSASFLAIRNCQRKLNFRKLLEHFLPICLSWKIHFTKQCMLCIPPTPAPRLNFVRF